MTQNSKHSLKRVDNPSRVAQYVAIKRRLNKKFGESGMTVNKLRDALNEHSDFEINYETLRKTLDSNCSTLDIYCVMAMCRYFNLDIAYVLAEADRPMNEVVNEDNPYVSAKFTELDDPKYHGTYYGYLFSPKRELKRLDPFCLQIGKEGNRVFARLEISFLSHDPMGSPQTEKKVLTGRPVLVNPGVVYIVFTENNGTYYIFSFSYVQYNRRGMYFRRGAVMTRGRNSSHQPMLQSFVMFNRQVPEENLEMVKGMLLLTDTRFHISEREFNALIESNQSVRRLADELKYIFDNRKEMYYLVDEMQLVHSLNEGMSKNEALAAIQLMKARSTDVSRVYFWESDDYSELSKIMSRPLFSAPPEPTNEIEKS